MSTENIQIIDGESHNESKTETNSNVTKPVLILGFVVAGIYLAINLIIMSQLAKLIPQEYTINLFGHSKTVHALQERFSNTYLLLFVLFPVAFIIEAILTGWKNSSFYQILFDRSPTVKLDLACLFYSITPVYQIIKFVATFGLATLVGKWINSHLATILPFADDLGTLPLLVQIPIFYVCYTFFDYWDHVVEHQKFFWVFHRFHHSAQEMTIVNSMRMHPVSFVNIFMIYAPMAILGASVEAMIWVNLIVQVVGILQHSKIDSNYGFLGQWVFQSPNHHRKHHAYDISDGVYNFSLMPLWDKLFGTWKDAGDQKIAVGVEKPYQQGYWFFGDVLRDYVEFFKGLVGIKVDPYDFDAPKDAPKT